MTASEKPNVLGTCDQDRSAQDPPFREHVRRTHADPVLRRLMVLVTVAVLLGLIGTVAAVLGATQTRQASQADVVRNATLIRELAELEKVQSDNHVEHRRRNEAIHADLCRLIYEIVQTAPSLRDRGIQPCDPALPESSLGAKD